MRNTTISIDGQDVPGVIAIPESGTGPGVIVIQEWWGLVPHIVDLVQRFAAAGYVALAVDHYRGVETTEPDEAQKLMMGLNIDQVAADLAAAATDLLSRPEVAGSKIGVVGFCMGGGLALLAPTVSDDIDCAVAFYPAMPWPHYAPDWSRYTGKAAVVNKAESDEASNGPAIAEYTAAIAEAGGDVAVFDYPGSVHAFFNDARPEVFQPENSEAAWQVTLEFLNARLG
ncbi:MAG: dienelactone hydrolase family protein [Actinomycetales bacterium]|nr:dienelactone hydrolase family protein [Actinomycetales bacterium]